MLVWTALLFFAQPDEPSEGKWSQVHFVEAVRLPTKDATGMKPPASDGVRLTFVVIPKPGASGLFTLAETRHVLLGHRRYPSGGPGSPEPQTEIFDLPKFMTSVRPDLRNVLPVDRSKDAAVLVVRIGGPALETDQPARVKVDVGWGEQTEAFWFTFNVPAPRAAADGSPKGIEGRPTPAWSRRHSAFGKYEATGARVPAS